MNVEEIFPLVNEKGEVIGLAPRRVCHNGSKLLHPVVHLYVFNSEGALYLQKRSAQKDIQPEKWDISAGGHINLNESPEEALLREAFEELNIRDFSSRKIWEHVYENPFEKQYAYSFVTVYDGVISPNPDELADGRFWSVDEINRSIGKGLFTVDFEMEFPAVFFKIFTQDGLVC
jgi:isopentenyldiphosphate isomerase